MRSTVRWTIDLDMNVSMSKSTRRSGDQPVQLRIDGFNSRWMLSSTDECFHLGMNAFISESTHSSQNQRIHLEINAFKPHFDVFGGEGPAALQFSDLCLL